MVNDQLNQLYLDLEAEGFSAKITLGETPSRCNEDDESLVEKRKLSYESLVMIYEENAPFPPPVEF